MTELALSSTGQTWKWYFKFGKSICSPEHHFVWQLQKAARRTAGLLNHVSSGEEAFEAAFLTKLPPSVSFDQLWHITLPMPGEEQMLRTDPSSWRY